MAYVGRDFVHLLVLCLALLGPILYHFNAVHVGSRGRKIVQVKFSGNQLEQRAESVACLPYRTADQWLGIDVRQETAIEASKPAPPAPWAEITLKQVRMNSDEVATSASRRNESKLLSKKVLARIRPCVQPTLLKLSHPMPRIALATAARGGDVYVRRLLEQLSGIATGSVYRSNSHLKREGFLAEGVSDNTVLLVTTHAHNASSSVWQKLTCADVDGVVLVARNPFDVVRSEFQTCYRQSRSTRKRRRKKGQALVLCKEKSWEEFVPGAVDRWQRFLFRWFTCSKPKLIIYFEDLHGRHLLKQLELLINFLKLEVLPDRVKCLSKYGENLIRYRPMTWMPFMPFTRQHLNHVQQAISQLSQTVTDAQLQQRYSLQTLCPNCAH